MEKRKISLHTRLICADAAGVVEGLAEGLKERCLKIQKGDATLVLNPPEVVDIDVEARVRDGRGKFSLEISWRIPDDETVAACDEVANLPGRDHLVPPGCADEEDVSDIDLDVALNTTGTPKTARTGAKPRKGKTHDRDSAPRARDEKDAAPEARPRSGKSGTPRPTAKKAKPEKDTPRRKS